MLAYPEVLPEDRDEAMALADRKTLRELINPVQLRKPRDAPDGEFVARGCIFESSPYSVTFLPTECIYCSAPLPIPRPPRECEFTPHMERCRCSGCESWRGFLIRQPGRQPKVCGSAECKRNLGRDRQRKWRIRQHKRSNTNLTSRYNGRPAKGRQVRQEGRTPTAVTL